MAIFHLSAQVISRSDGRTSVAAAAYRAGIALHDPRLNQVFDFTHKGGIDHSEISLPEHAPEWMADRAKLWASVELGEKRRDSQVAREFNIAIPVELPREEKIALARRWVQGLVDMGMVVDWNAHHLEGSNPHFHAMATMRRVENGTWSRTKARDWNATELVERWRESWADLANAALAAWAEQASGRSQEPPRISHLSHEARGIQEKPQRRVRAATWALAKKGVTWAVRAVREATHRPLARPTRPARPKVTHATTPVLPFLADLFRVCAPGHPGFGPRPEAVGGGGRPGWADRPQSRAECEAPLGLDGPTTPPGPLAGGGPGVPPGPVGAPGLVGGRAWPGSISR